jgi:radical SAM-linked protein
MPEPIRRRVRIRFRKEGDLRHIGHRDLLRTMERLFRRAHWPLAMTQGFHPKPRMIFPSALAVGVASLDEVVEVELAALRDAEALRESLEPHLPAGLVPFQLELLPPGTPKPRVRRVRFSIRVPSERQPGLANRMAAFLAEAEHPVDRGPGRKTINLRSYVEALALVEGSLLLDLRVAPDGAARPREVLFALGVDDLEALGFHLTRDRVELES